MRSVSAFRSVATYAGFLFAASVIISCASGGTRGENESASSGEVPDELSIKADRSALAEERKNIPEERRRENDELAALLQMIQAKPNQEPGEVRDRFNKIVRDRREKSDKGLRKRRDDFSRSETNAREAFLKSLKDERNSYLKSKHTSDERKAFFDKQEDKRKDFFANQTDKRHDFESKVTDERKAFEDYMKEKTSQFNDEMRAYTASFYDRKKAEALVKGVKAKGRAQVPDTVTEPGDRDSIPQGPAIPLGPPSDERQ